MQPLAEDRIPTRRPARPSSLALALGLAALAGCASTQEGGMRDTVTQIGGQYPPPPPGLVRARLGVPAFTVIRAGKMSANLDAIAADQMITLVTLSGRFDVIERAQLQQLLDEQNLEGIVRGSELSQVSRVRGVDYVLLGRVTNFRIKEEKTNKSFSFGSIPFLGDNQYLRGAGVGKGEMAIKAECGVDLRLVDPSTGAVVAAHFGEFERIDAASAMGISLGGFHSEGSAEIEISDDEEGQVLRLALDDALRKMMPQIDRVLAALPRATAAALPSEATVAQLAGGLPALSVADVSGTQGAAAPRFCSTCGDDLAPGARFCGTCGTAVR